MDFVETVCERLRAKCTVRSSSEQVAADLALYVPPLCSPTKDTPDGDAGIRDLDDTVMTWLDDDDSQVLLLHGQSGSGTSLYCLLLEQRLWQAYRRGTSSHTPYTPLLVSLPAAKEASKSAVEEPLRECGLSTLTDAWEAGRRRWLIILDGFDEVQGNTNFIIGNKLNGVKGVKVRGRGVAVG